MYNPCELAYCFFCELYLTFKAGLFEIQVIVVSIQIVLSIGRIQVTSKGAGGIK